MDSKIVVVGSEEFALGFELVGIDSYPVEELESLISSKTNNIGIVIISQKDYNSQSIKIKNIIDKLIRPIVVILADEDIKGNNLRDQVMKVLGVDLMK